MEPLPVGNPPPAPLPANDPARQEFAILRVLETVSRYATYVLLGIVCTAVGIMCAVTVLQVFCRYVLDSALYWPEEISRASLVWLSFAGAAVGVRQGTHIAITAIYDRFPRRLRAVADLVSTIAIGFVGYAILDLGWAVAELARSDRSTSLGMSLFWYRLALPVGGLGILLNTAPHLVRALIGIVRPTAVADVQLSSGGGVV